MNNRLYYGVMSATAWIIIGLGLVSVGLYVFGLNPGMSPGDLTAPTLSVSILLLVQSLKVQDREIQNLQRMNDRLIRECDELYHRLEHPANRINE
jgi:hypothetical protein